MPNFGIAERWALSWQGEQIWLADKIADDDFSGHHIGSIKIKIKLFS